MSDTERTSDAPETTTAGAYLRASREAAGLSVDVVAQQLKLAPRQVRAIEEDDYARLPGRTFVRGFVRNYARLLGIDSDALLSILPGSEAQTPLERQTITSSGRPMGEMPADAGRRHSWARWLIPLALLAIIGVAAFYEFSRQAMPGRLAAVFSTSSTPAAPAASSPTPAASTANTGGATSMALPNPLEAAKSEPPVVPTTAATAIGAAAPAGAGAVSVGLAPGAAPAADTPLLLTFIGTSWVEVKDGNNAIIYLQTGLAGTTQALGGTLPLEVVVGNAAQVAVTFRGTPIDLAPYTRANVARLTLK